jgi:hypothetical protein
MASSPEKENTIGEVPIEELPASKEKAASVSRCYVSLVYS